MLAYRLVISCGQNAKRMRDPGTGHDLSMSSNEAHTTASPSDVWKVLATPSLYGNWVVGTKEVVDAQPEWPRPGASLHHRSGFGPLNVDDITRVMESTENEHLRLEAHLGKIGTAIVDIDVRADATGSTIELREQFVHGPPAHLKPITNVMLAGRNEETLRRLVQLAETS